MNRLGMGANEPTLWHSSRQLQQAPPRWQEHKQALTRMQWSTARPEKGVGSDAGSARVHLRTPRSVKQTVRGSTRVRAYCHQSHSDRQWSGGCLGLAWSGEHRESV